MYEKITSQNVVMYAIHNYDNPQCEGEKEFQDDLKRFKYIKRLLRKYHDTDVLKERLLLNHIIVLKNVFGPEASTTLLLYKIQSDYWPALNVVVIGNQPNGKNINLNCGSTNTDILKKRVLSENADIGIALDGDADRIVIIDEKGNEVDGNLLFALIIKNLKENELLENKIVVSTIMHTHLVVVILMDLI